MYDFLNVVKEIESALNKSFSYDKINWMMLMMKDPHVHFHIVPRYKEPRDFAGEKWVDPFGKNHIWKIEAKDLSQEQLNEIKEEIMKNL